MNSFLNDIKKAIDDATAACNDYEYDRYSKEMKIGLIKRAELTLSFFKLSVESAKELKNMIDSCHFHEVNEDAIEWFSELINTKKNGGNCILNTEYSCLGFGFGYWLAVNVVKHNIYEYAKPLLEWLDGKIDKCSWQCGPRMDINSRYDYMMGVETFMPELRIMDEANRLKKACVNSVDLQAPTVKASATL